MTRISRKILISLVVGAFAYGATEITGQPAVWSITISVLIGGVAMVAQFLIDFETRLTAVELASRQHMVEVAAAVQSGFQKINDVTHLFHQVEESALRTELVTGLVRSSTQINHGSPPLVFRFAHAEIERMSEFMRDLGNGGPIIYEGEDRDWLLALARNSELSIDATSLSHVDGDGNSRDGGFWNSDLGRRYLEVQRDSVRRGVRIRRVFLVRSTNARTDEILLGTCRLQQEAGIEVRVLDWSDLPPTRREAPFDFILFDGAISYEVTPAPQVDEVARPTILNTRLELHPDRVQNRTQRFEQLWAFGREVGRKGLGPSPVSR